MTDFQGCALTIKASSSPTAQGWLLEVVASLLKQLLSSLLD